MIQGAGRLRQLLQGQTVEYALTEACKTYLCGNDHDLTINHLLAISKYQTIRENEERLYRSLKQQMHNEVRSRAMEKLRRAETVHQAIKFFLACEKVLVDESPDSPWKMFGSQLKEIDRNQSLKNYQKVCLDLVNSIPIFTKTEKSSITGALNSYTKKIDECHFATKVRDFAIAGETQVEVLKEMELKNEVEKENSSSHQERLAVRQRALWPDKMDLYQDDWIKESSLFSISRKIIQLFNAIIALLGKLKD